MTRLNFVLLLAVILSALFAVQTAYEARRLFTANHRADQEARRLAGEHKRLEADRELEATNQRVDRTARQTLKMATATPAVTLYEGADGLLPAAQPAEASSADAARAPSRRPSGARP